MLAAPCKKATRLSSTLQSISARLDSFDRRFDAAAKLADARHNEVLARFATVDEKFERLLNTFEFDKSVGWIESH